MQVCNAAPEIDLFVCKHNCERTLVLFKKNTSNLTLTDDLIWRIFLFVLVLYVKVTYENDCCRLPYRRFKISSKRWLYVNLKSDYIDLICESSDILHVYSNLNQSTLCTCNTRHRIDFQLGSCTVTFVGFDSQYRLRYNSKFNNSLWSNIVHFEYSVVIILYTLNLIWCIVSYKLIF